jgi:hypothetical protein
MFSKESTTIHFRVYCHYFLFCDFLLSNAVCSFVNLNQYIGIFPPTYFVKVHAEKILSENLGPSKTPLTILVYNSSLKAGDVSKSWCKFFPVRGHFIGSRTQNTLNLIWRNITYCYTDGKGSNKEQCSFMDIVNGRIKESLELNSFCAVSHEHKHTLIIAETWEHNLIEKKSALLWNKLRGKFYPNFVLVFVSYNRNSVKIVCSFKLQRTDPSLHCSSMEVISETVFRTISVSPVYWAVGKELSAPVPVSSNFSGFWELNSMNPVEQSLITDILRRTNESLYKYSVSTIRRVQHWQVHNYLTEQFILVASRRRKFISCFSKPILGFEMYGKPFRVEVWLSLFMFYSMTAAFISVYNTKLKLSESFSPYFFFLSTLFEEPYSVPSALWNNRVFKTVTISWLLTAMIFTNLYVGLMISDVTSPLQGERLASFDDVLDTEIVYDKMSNLDSGQILGFWSNIYNGPNKGTFLLDVDKMKCNSDFDFLGYKARYEQSVSQGKFVILQKLANDCGGREISNRVQKVLLRHPWMYSEFKELEIELVRGYKDYYNMICGLRGGGGATLNKNTL